MPARPRPRRGVNPFCETHSRYGFLSFTSSSGPE